MTDYIELLYIAIKSSLEAGLSTLKYYNGEIDISYKADNSPLTLADLESDQIIRKNLNPTTIPILSEEDTTIPFDQRKNWERFWLVDPLDGTKEFVNKSAEYTINIALIEDNLPALGVVYAPVPGIIYFAAKEIGSYKLKIESEMEVGDIISHAKRLQAAKLPDKLRVVASRSHLNSETEKYIHKLNKHIPIGEMNSYGSSLKLCMVAEGNSDIYPRLGPTMEWDTAAGHAIAQFAGCPVIDIQRKEPLRYNKENLLNPHFVVCHPLLKELVQSIMD